MTDHHLNSARTAAVSNTVHWRPIDANTPRGVKVQMISDKYGIAQYGHLQAGNTYYTHWAPVPSFKKEET